MSGRLALVVVVVVVLTLAWRWGWLSVDELPSVELSNDQQPGPESICAWPGHMN